MEKVRIAARKAGVRECSASGAPRTRKTLTSLTKKARAGAYPPDLYECLPRRKAAALSAHEAETDKVLAMRKPRPSSDEVPLARIKRRIDRRVRRAEAAEAETDARLARRLRKRRASPAPAVDGAVWRDVVVRDSASHGPSVSGACKDQIVCAPGITQEERKKRFKAESLKLHPDKQPPARRAEYEEKFAMMRKCFDECTEGAREPGGLRTEDLVRQMQTAIYREFQQKRSVAEDDFADYYRSWIQSRGDSRQFRDKYQKAGWVRRQHEYFSEHAEELADRIRDAENTLIQRVEEAVVSRARGVHARDGTDAWSRWYQDEFMAQADSHFADLRANADQDLVEMQYNIRRSLQTRDDDDTDALYDRRHARVVEALAANMSLENIYACFRDAEDKFEAERSEARAGELEDGELEEGEDSELEGLEDLGGELFDGAQYMPRFERRIVVSRIRRER